MLDDRDTNIFLISWSFSSKQHIQHLPDWIWLSFEFNLAGHKHGVGRRGGGLLPTHYSTDSPIYVQEASPQDPTSPPNQDNGTCLCGCNYVFPRSETHGFTLGQKTKSFFQLLSFFGCIPVHTVQLSQLASLCHGDILLPGLVSAHRLDLEQVLQHCLL